MAIHSCGCWGQGEGKEKTYVRMASWFRVPHFLCVTARATA